MESRRGSPSGWKGLPGGEREVCGENWDDTGKYTNRLNKKNYTAARHENTDSAVVPEIGLGLQTTFEGSWSCLGRGGILLGLVVVLVWTDYRFLIKTQPTL